METSITSAENGWILNTPNGRRFLSNPDMFAVYSTSGNQWRKLMYFYEDWQHLNILISIYDIYRSDASIIREMLRLGIHEHIKALRTRIGHKVLQNNLPQYQSYHKYINLENDISYEGIFMLDSGGFSFGEPKKLEHLLQSPLPIIRRFGRIMLAIAELEAEQSHWNTQKLLRLAKIAQKINFLIQIKLKPDILITLDRIIPYEMPLWLKIRRIRFNLTCSRTALELWAQLKKPKPVLFTPIHPLGPSFSSVGKAISEKEAENIYTKTFIIQLKYLLRAEREVGVMFGGFAVGSLVPITNQKFLKIIGNAIQQATRSLKINDRPLHAFGAADNKATFLNGFGFTSFDSNSHVIKARNRQIYDPTSAKYRKAQPPDKCSCIICSRHSADELLENRSGVKEVATVLQSLHNFYANHLVYLNTMRKKQ